MPGVATIIANIIPFRLSGTNLACQASLLIVRKREPVIERLWCADRIKTSYGITILESEVGKPWVLAICKCIDGHCLCIASVATPAMQGSMAPYGGAWLGLVHALNHRYKSPSFLSFNYLA